ncbi:MAG: DUF6069 family protein [Thermomicrobiales bacterium]
MLQHPRFQRLLVLLAGVAAGLTGYLLIRLLGVDVVIDGDEEIGAADVVIASLLGGLLAWLVFFLLSRFGYQRLWPFVGSTALAISMLGPSYMADGSSTVALICLHFAVAIVLIWGLALVSASTTDCETAPAEQRRRAALRFSRHS